MVRIASAWSMQWGWLFHEYSHTCRESIRFPAFQATSPRYWSRSTTTTVSLEPLQLLLFAFMLSVHSPAVSVLHEKHAGLPHLNDIGWFDARR